MNLTSRLTRPFKRLQKNYADKINGFIVPIKDAVVNLLGHVPNIKAFAGSEDLAEDSANPAETEDGEGSRTSGKMGLVARFKNFKKSLKEMSDFQKLILLTIAICLPAGILISTILVGFIRKYKNK